MFEEINLHVNKQSSELEVKNGSKFRKGFHANNNGKSLTINEYKILSTKITKKFDEIDKILSIILVNQERMEKNMEKELEDRRRELDDIKATLTSTNVTIKSMKRNLTHVHKKDFVFVN